MRRGIFETARSTKVKQPLREAFTYRGSEDLQRIANKVAAIIGRKFGRKAVAGHCPYYFSRDNEQYIAYFAPTDSDNVAFRINFRLDSERPSTRIASIDLYTSLKSIEEPDITLHITDPNMNIVQIIKQVDTKLLTARNLHAVQNAGMDTLHTERGLEQSGVEFHQYEKRTYAQEKRYLIEASKKSVIQSFLQAEGGSYADFVRWATAQGEPIGSAAFFQSVKRELDAHGGAPSSVQSGKGYEIRVPTEEEPLWAEEDAAAFEDIEENEAIEKFEELEVVLRKMANDDPNFNALFVYGSAGVGKSFSIKKVFQEEAATLQANDLKVEIKTGAIAGFTGLITLLFEHRDNYILVLDDNDEILKNRNGVNVLKGAMNTNIEDRRVQYTVPDRSGFAKDKDEEAVPAVIDDEVFDEDLEETIHVRERGGSYIFEKALRPTRVAENYSKDNETLKDFYFRSKIIFISNLLEIPSAIDDRCYSIDMVFTYEQIMEMVKNVMEFIDIEGVSLDIRMDVYEFLKRSKYAIEYKLGIPVQMTFRKFRNACLAWEGAVNGGLGVTKAKKLAYKQLKGSLGKS